MEHKSTPLDRGSPGLLSDGTACLRDGEEFTILHESGGSEKVDFDQAVKQTINRDLFSENKWDGLWDRSRSVDTSVVIDKRGFAYTIIVPRYSNLKTAALLWSSAGCRDWHALALSSTNATIERPDTFNDQSGPPTILSYENYGALTGSRLWLDVFEIAKGEVRRSNGFGALVADNSLLVANHSGGGNSTYTTAQAIFIVYPTTDHSAPGTQAMGRQFDRRTGQWVGEAEPIGRSTTRVTPDDHDIPAIAMKADGKAIVVIGAHHAIFQMLTARAANSLTSGWTAPELVGAPTLGPEYSSYSYVSLNVSRRGTINIVARAEGRRYIFELVQFRKTGDGGWTNWPGGLPHRVIATPNRQYYGVWHQQMTETESGRLYLSFDYVANQLTDEEAQMLGLAGEKKYDCRISRCFYRNVPEIEPRTLVSDDEGLTWH